MHHRWSFFACEWTFEICAFLTDGCPLSVAIWERNRIVIIIACGSWLANFASCIYCTFFFCVYCTAIHHTSGVATIRTIWIAPLRICGITNMLRARISIISTITTEVVLLVLMVIGLLRWRTRANGGLWQLLFTQVGFSGCMYCVDTMSDNQPQGLAWVVVTLVADIPPLVRLCRANAARITHVRFPGFHSLEFERYVLLRIFKLKVGTQEKLFCPVVMDVVRLLAMDLEVELTLEPRSRVR